MNLRRWRDPKRATALATDLRTLADLLDNGAATTLAHRNEHTTDTDGYPTTTLGGPSSRGGLPANPTARAALAHHQADPVLNHTRRALAATELAATAARTAAGALLTALRQSTIDHDQPAGSGDCRRCDRYCTGAEHDRRRSGYCPACYRAWLRAGRPDRPAFERTQDR